MRGLGGAVVAHRKRLREVLVPFLSAQREIECALLFLQDLGDTQAHEQASDGDIQQSLVQGQDQSLYDIHAFRGKLNVST